MEGLQIGTTLKRNSPETTFDDGFHDADGFDDLELCFNMKDEEFDLEEDNLERLRIQR